jgi:hypothetical protein
VSGESVGFVGTTPPLRVPVCNAVRLSKKVTLPVGMPLVVESTVTVGVSTWFALIDGLLAVMPVVVGVREALSS